jgi:peptide/nickel transport system substrate-binding protein
MFADKKSRSIALFALLSVIGLALSACATEQVEVTRIVTEKETVVETVIEKETVVVEGTPEVREQEVTRVVEREKVVTATPEPTEPPEPPELVYGNLPRNETFIAAGTASNDVWDTFTTMSGPLANAYSGHVQLAVEYPFVLNNGVLYPYLAQKWEYNEDGTEMTLFITEGATWNDGTPVTMDDWTFTLDYLAENKDAGVPLGTLLDSADYRVEGTDQIIFSLLDPDTGEPQANFRFHTNFLNGGFRPLPKHVWEGKDPLTFKNNPPVESGPYTLVSCNADTKTCIWERREDYWKMDEMPAPKYFVFTRQPEPDLLTQELLAGNYDIAQLGYKQSQQVMRSNPYIAIVSGPDVCPRRAYFNVEHPPLDDPAMRTAISLLIDRERAGLLDLPPRPVQLVPWPYTGDMPDTRFYDPADAEAYDWGIYDPERAAAVLDEAGYSLVDGKRLDKNGDPISINALTFDPSVHGAAASGWPTMLSLEAAKLGIEVNVQVFEVGTYFENAANGDFDIMYGWGCPNPEDPILAYSELHSRNYVPLGESAGYGGQMTRYQNPELDALVDEVAGLSPANLVTEEKYKELFAILARDKPYISLFAIEFTMPVNTEYWTGFVTDPPEVEPWYWDPRFRTMLALMEPTQ